ncbi:MAG: MarR family transcriptional regulator [Caldilineaceae bacterium]
MTIVSGTGHQQVTGEKFKQFLADIGVQDFHGLELLRLVRMCANAYETSSSERLRNERISEQRWRLLLRLLVEEQQGNLDVSPTHLSEAQHVSKNTISSLLRSLEEQGLIERTLDQTDRRQFRIRLSEEGRSLMRESMPVHIAFLNNLTSALNEEEVNTLHRLLMKLHRSIRVHCGGGSETVDSRTVSQ